MTNPAQKTAETDSVVSRAGEAAAQLREAYDKLVAMEDRIARIGQDRVEATADAYRRAIRVLDKYEDDATGSGNFEAFVAFEDEFVSVTSPAADVRTPEAFEAAQDTVDKRRLSQSDFDAAREALEPAGEYVELLEDRDARIEEYREARRHAKEALKDVTNRIADLERVAEYDDVDIDAPIDQLRDPIAAYHDSVRDAFESFKKESSTRALLDFIERTERYPLVDFDQPPRELREYVEETPTGEEPLPTLLEYVDYSPSKLDHYVADPGALRTTVAVHRTYLDRISAAPLTIEWPPGPAEELRYRLDELISVVSRLDEEEPVVRLREIRSLTREDEYEQLRRVAVAREELSESERALLSSGDIDDRLAAARDMRSLLESILTETER